MSLLGEDIIKELKDEIIEAEKGLVNKNKLLI